MKKFFSVFLMVCMLLTSLSVGVSADYTVDGTTNTYIFDTPGDLARYYNNGEWNLSSDGTNSVKLGDFSIVENMGMSFKKIVLDDTYSGTLTPTNAATLSIRGEIINEANMGKTYNTKDIGGAEVITNSVLDAQVAASGTHETGKLVKYTIYAYSKSEIGEPLTVDFTVPEKSTAYDFYELNLDQMEIPASKLYSEDGIPHKIDFILYYDRSSTVQANPLLSRRNGFNYVMYIDGLYHSGREIGSSVMKATTNNPSSPMKNGVHQTAYSWVSPQINISSDGTNPVEWSATEMYICADPAGKGQLVDLTSTPDAGEYLTLHNYSDIYSTLFQEFVFKTPAAGNLRSGFIEGVDADLASELETLYTTAPGGDRVVTVEYGTAPASIWTGASSNVKLVKKSDGTVYGVEDKDSVTGTFDEYVISVNGVYTKVEIPPVSYDVATKTAAVRKSALPEGTTALQIVVAAYNSNGAMEKISVSESKTDFSSDSITHTVVDNTFPTDAYKYKVFVFDSLTSAKPLIEALGK